MWKNTQVLGTLNQENFEDRHNVVKPFPFKFCVKSYSELNNIKVHLKVKKNIENFENKIKVCRKLKKETTMLLQVQ